MMERTSGYDWQRLTIVIVCIISIKAWVLDLAGIELHFDEAQYWEWSQQLDWGYYSKGPLIAWLIALSTSLFGHGEWQVRLIGWIIHGLFLAATFTFSQQVWHSRVAGWWAFSLAATTPLYFTLGMVMTTDNLLLLSWTLAMWAIYRALILDHPLAWYPAALAIGIGALGKLSIGLLPLFTAAIVLMNKRWRPHLNNPHLWGAVVVILLCMSPMLIWNANHDWVMFRHEMGRAGNTTRSLLSVVEFFAGQMAALSPLIVALAVVTLRKQPRHEGERLLWLLGLAGLCYFSYLSLGGNIKLNWAAPVYIAFIILLSGHVTALGAHARKLLYTGLMLSIVIISVAFFPQLLGLAANNDPFKKLKYWQQPIKELSSRAGQPDFILTDTYHLAAELSFYWPQPIVVYITGTSQRRFNQHDLWPGIEREAGRNGIFISQFPSVPTLLPAAFQHCKPMASAEAFASDGTLMRTLYAHQCVGYQPIEWPRPTTY